MAAPRKYAGSATDRSAMDRDPSDRPRGFRRQNEQYREASSPDNRESRGAAAGPPGYSRARRSAINHRPGRLDSAPDRGSIQDVAKQVPEGDYSASFTTWTVTSAVTSRCNFTGTLNSPSVLMGSSS